MQLDSTTQKIPLDKYLCFRYHIGMELIDAAKQELLKCETALRELVSKAAVGGEYDALNRIAPVAQEVARLAASVQGTSVSSSTSVQSAPRAERRAPGRVGRRGEYPNFYRRGDDLVKVGWSKREKAEYIQRAPKAVLLATVAAVDRLGTGGKLFTAEQLLAAIAKDAEFEVPVYQTYACLAWLRNGKLVVQHGREGYSIADRVNVVQEFETHWAALPDWRR